MHNLSWEEAVTWLRKQPDKEWLVRACYFDDPLSVAAERYARSSEWQAMRELLPCRAGHALDLGAGRGISSYALAQDRWKVTALEPDPSGLVGAEAIRELVSQFGLPIAIVRGVSESLPFGDGIFDLVHARQALHHCAHLEAVCREVFRVLKPGGTFVATREHVISRPQDLKEFQDGHPLHRLYGGENAYLLHEYTSAMSGSGFEVSRVLGPFDTAVNYYPMSREEWLMACTAPVARVLGVATTSLLINESHTLGRRMVRWLSWLRSCLSNAPGRLYSFVAKKPMRRR